MKTSLFIPSAPAISEPALSAKAFMHYPACALTESTLSPLTQTPLGQTPPKETVRHILLGTPGAVRQTIHLLHILRYAETGLWSPVMRIETPLAIAPAQGEAMSLLRKSI